MLFHINKSAHHALCICAVLMLCLTTMAGCSQMELASHVVKQTPITDNGDHPGVYKVGSSYKIAGKRYTPRETFSFEQKGIASWYGPNFHGKQTANGEIFDKYDLTAAHKTLQLPSIIRVTNLENGRSIVARVNDRGPFSKGRILDLSERSAELLGFKHQGTARVKIEVLPEPSRQVAQIAKSGRSTRGYEIALNEGTKQAVIPPTQTASIQGVTTNHNYFLQAGSFNNVQKAELFINQVRPYANARINPTMINGHQFYRVQVGPVSSPQQAQNIAMQLADANITQNIGEPFIIRE